MVHPTQGTLVSILGVLLPRPVPNLQLNLFFKGRRQTGALPWEKTVFEWVPALGLLFLFGWESEKTDAGCQQGSCHPCLRGL